MRVLAVIMAGGEGTRLSILSEKRAKPAVPFAGKYRIIDFTLSNTVNSGIFNVAVLTQYRPHSLNDHIGIGRPWDLDRQTGGIKLLQPYQARKESDWYRGTADAVYQNLGFLDPKADTLLILSGDHIYKMDYGPMLNFHADSRADLTVAAINVSPAETHRFGILATDASQRIVEFQEKPKVAKGTLASMGVYVFRRELLEEVLEPQDGKRPVDFGKDVIPAMISRHRVYAYPFKGHWVDVGTVQSYWEANMELLENNPPLDLYDPDWVIHTRSEERPPVKLGPASDVYKSLLSNGCIVEGRVEHSVLGPGVRVSPTAIVRDSIIMNDTWIGPGAMVDRAIVDKEVTIGAEAVVGLGEDNPPNKEQPDRLNTGITVIGKQAQIPAGIRIGRNCLINTDVQEDRFRKKVVPSGESV